MKPTTEIDPDLHALRTIARSRSGRKQSLLEQARFGVYVAFEEGNPDRAQRWATALRAALLDLGADDLRQLGLDALTRIEAAIWQPNGCKP